MRVGEGYELRERALVQPRVGVQQQDVAARCPFDAGVPAVGEPAVLLLDELGLREALAHELERAVGRAVVDHHALDAAHALEALLEPRQGVVGHDDDRGVAHRRRSPSRSTITRPGKARAIVTRKKRKPVAKARSAGTPRLPRNETKNDSRTARPFTVEGTSMARKSSGPIT